VHLYCSAYRSDSVYVSRNVELLAFAAARRAAARLLQLTAGRRPCSNGSTSPGRRAHSSKLAAAACGSRMEQTLDFSHVTPSFSDGMEL